jgi:UDP-glucuronate 4-epimerase
MGKFLITGVGRFIGFYTARKLLENGNQIIGIDNLNRHLQK